MLGVLLELPLRLAESDFDSVFIAVKERVLLDVGV